LGSHIKKHLTKNMEDPWNRKSWDSEKWNLNMKEPLQYAVSRFILLHLSIQNLLAADGFVRTDNKGVEKQAAFIYDLVQQKMHQVNKWWGTGSPFSARRSFAGHEKQVLRGQARMNARKSSLKGSKAAEEKLAARGSTSTSSSTSSGGGGRQDVGEAAMDWQGEDEGRPPPPWRIMRRREFAPPPPPPPPAAQRIQLQQAWRCIRNLPPDLYAVLEDHEAEAVWTPTDDVDPPSPAAPSAAPTTPSTGGTGDTNDCGWTGDCKGHDWKRHSWKRHDLKRHDACDWKGQDARDGGRSSWDAEPTAARARPILFSVSLASFGLEQLDSTLTEHVRISGGGASAIVADDILQHALERSRHFRADVIIDARGFPDPNGHCASGHIGFHPEIISRVVRHKNFCRWLEKVQRQIFDASTVCEVKASADGMRYADVGVALYCKSGRHRSVACSLILQYILAAEGWRCPEVHHLSEWTWRHDAARCSECSGKPQSLHEALQQAHNTWLSIMQDTRRRA